MLTLLNHTYSSLSRTFWNETIKNSTEIHTDPHNTNWKGTGTYSYTDCYSILTYPALRCNLDVLMEKISTLFNYILSLPMLL